MGVTTSSKRGEARRAPSPPMPRVSREKVFEMAEASVGPGSIAHNHVFPVSPYDMGCAMLAADALGKERKALFLK